jgi:hypothetical protein
MTWRENEVVRSHFSSFLRRANDLVNITFRQDSKNPSYEQYLLTLGKTSRETVGTALLVSTEFLHSLTDINDVFQDSRVVCLRLAAEITSFVNRGDGARPDETEDLVGLRNCLKEKFARLKSNWENLVQLTTDYDETVEFAELAGLIQVTETATNNALLGSEDLLTKLRDRDLCDGIAYNGADDMSDSEDDGGDSTLRDGADDVGGADMTEDYFLWNECDAADDHKQMEDETGSLPAVTRMASEDIEAQTLSGRTTFIDTAVSDVRPPPLVRGTRGATSMTMK